MYPKRVIVHMQPAGRSKTTYVVRVVPGGPASVAGLVEGDVVVCINARDVVLTRDKLDGKQYVKHTGYPGGQKWETARNMLARSPEELMKKAVGRMLPKNKLRLGRLRKLRIYPGAEHPFAAQHLTRLQPEKPRELRPRRNAAEMTTRPGDEQEIF